MELQDKWKKIETFSNKEICQKIKIPKNCSQNKNSEKLIIFLYNKICKCKKIVFSTFCINNKRNLLVNILNLQMNFSQHLNIMKINFLDDRRMPNSREKKFFFLNRHKSSNFLSVSFEIESNGIWNKFQQKWSSCGLSCIHREFLVRAESDFILYRFRYEDDKRLVDCQ